MSTQPASETYRIEPAYPDVTVQLTDADGNVFAVISRVARALRAAGHPEAAHTFAAEATHQGSYEEVLQLVMRTVDWQ
jgi:hypothetical protein